MAKKKVKNYVLDTNILLSDPESIMRFEDNDVWLTSTTLQELDHKKTAPGELGFNARESIRVIESLRVLGDLTKGVKIEGGGRFRIIIDCDNLLPKTFDMNVPDNRIIASTLTMAKKQDEKFILVTNDVSMRINASICGLDVELYRNDHIASSEKEEYTGHATINVEASIIDSLYSDKIVESGDVFASVGIEPVENMFLTLKACQKSALAIYQKGKIKLVSSKKVYKVSPKNAAQIFALYALTAPVSEIPFVILRGPAGTAKTFLSLAAGLDQLNTSGAPYNKVLISRNNVMSDADFGYLPGDIDEKMTPLMAPFYDNLESLVRGNEDKESNEQIQMQVNDMFESGLIAVCPLAYMRGRSITNSFLIVDESQNASRSQMRDIVTRAGKNCKVVIMGDPNQIDAHTLDKWNNGLVFAAETMKGSDICAQITFNEEECVRSELAVEAIKRMQL